MGLDLVVLGTASLLCIAAVLCAIVFAIRRRPGPVSICGFTVAGLSALIVADVVVTALLDSAKPAAATGQAVRSPIAATASPRAAPSPTPMPTATPTPAPMRPTADAKTLRMFRTHWGEVVRVSAAALKAHDTAGEYLRRDDSAHAIVALKTCQDTANGIATVSFNSPLDAMYGFDAELSDAVKRVANDLTYGCRSARTYLDTNAPSDFEDAKARFADVVEGVFHLETLARSRYESMGGNPSDLASFKTAVR